MNITLEKHCTTNDRKRGRPSYILSYDEARNILKSKRLNNLHEYNDWIEKEQPEGLSKNPYHLYRYHGTWVSWSHYLGKTDYIKPKVKEDENITSQVKFRSIKSIILQILGIK